VTGGGKVEEGETLLPLFCSFVAAPPPPPPVVVVVVVVATPITFTL
jgi:hypothetical protein